MQLEKEKLFLWRGLLEETQGGGTPPWAVLKYHIFNKIEIDYNETINTKCPYCKNNFLRTDLSFKRDTTGRRVERLQFDCEYCGFRYSTSEEKYIYEFLSTVRAATLLAFDFNDSAVGLDELGSHLRRRFKDVYSLSPRRFEELVADVFRNMGYSVRLTQQSRDGGFDLVLLEKSGQEKILVECKRYAESRKIGVATVRQLIGVQVIENVRKAKLVTTSDFTNPALDVAKSIAARPGGFELDLISADRLLKHLDVYNLNLPPLDVVYRKNEAKT